MIKDEVLTDIGGIPIEVCVANALAEKGLTLSVAESLTGGMVTARLINVAGISKNFREGIVAYANEAKVARLGVKVETLKKYGAVSAQTAEEMAAGLISSGADIAVSTTGIAGPSGGSDEKPVGLVWFGFATKDGVISKQQIFSGNRAEIRKKSTNYALYNLFLLIGATN